MITYVNATAYTSSTLRHEYFRTIESIFEGEIYFTPRHLEFFSWRDMFAEVSYKIQSCDCGITFLSTGSSGPLIEVGLLAAAHKPQAIIGKRHVLRGNLLRGLPNVVGFARIDQPAEVSELLHELKDKWRSYTRTT